MLFASINKRGALLYNAPLCQCGFRVLRFCMDGCRLLLDLAHYFWDPVRLSVRPAGDPPPPILIHDAVYSGLTPPSPRGIKGDGCPGDRPFLGRRPEKRAALLFLCHLPRGINDCLMTTWEFTSVSCVTSVSAARFRVGVFSECKCRRTAPSRSCSLRGPPAICELTLAIFCGMSQNNLTFMNSPVLIMTGSRRECAIQFVCTRSLLDCRGHVCY